ncbi:hypothetical protein ABH922_002214 [Rhodococcus sp. 27YEA15]|uniref:hypothetical protein n=1 Tax=Rhodococcus sp. 27YEA15 TaxID=3156259 RepID=UPI003C7C65AF
MITQFNDAATHVETLMEVVGSGTVTACPVDPHTTAIRRRSLLRRGSRALHRPPDVLIFLSLMTAVIVNSAAAAVPLPRS